MTKKATLPAVEPYALSSGDVTDIAEIILTVDRYRTVEDCAREIVRAVQRLQAEKDKG